MSALGYASPCSLSRNAVALTSNRMGGLLDPAAERAEVHQAGVSRRNLPILEEEQRRDALNPELSGKPRLGLHIDLDQPRPWLQRLCGPFKHGRHRPAGPAPRGPEIHDDRDVGAGKMPSE